MRIDDEDGEDVLSLSGGVAQKQWTIPYDKEKNMHDRKVSMLIDNSVDMTRWIIQGKINRTQPVEIKTAAVYVAPNSGTDDTVRI